MAIVDALMTAEEFAQRPDAGYPEELVQGKVVAMPPADRRHGYVCGQTYYLLRQFIEQNQLGRVMTNDSAVNTERGPDTVRGADVCYYSYGRLPHEPLSAGYGPETPEIVVEVRSQDERWPDIYENATEYLNVNMLIVVVLDPNAQTAHIFRAGHLPELLQAHENLALPGVLDGFVIRVAQFFE